MGKAFKPALPMSTLVRSDGREMTLGTFLDNWGLPQTSNLVDGLKAEGWGGGGSVSRVELVKVERIPTGAFIRAGYSFRPITTNGRSGWAVYPKGLRDDWSRKATMHIASDQKTWLVDMNMALADARPSFSEACDLVMARLPREG